MNFWNCAPEKFLRIGPGSWVSAYRGKWSQLTPWKNGWKLQSESMPKKSSFPCLCYILKAIRASRCRERRCADHIFIPIYFIMHHFVVKIFFASGGKGALTPLTKICGRSCRCFLPGGRRRLRLVFTVYFNGAVSMQYG